MKKLDARGLSCPEPVVMLQRAMRLGESAYEIIVDNVAAKENVTRCAQHQKYRVTVFEDGGEYRLVIEK